MLLKGASVISTASDMALEWASVPLSIAEQGVTTHEQIDGWGLAGGSIDRLGAVGQLDLPASLSFSRASTATFTHLALPTPLAIHLVGILIYMLRMQ